LDNLAKRKKQSLGGEFTPMGLGDFFHDQDDPLRPDEDDDDDDDEQDEK
jgi:MoxR-like ATPase